jgi:hypothetical protein
MHTTTYFEFVLLTFYKKKILKNLSQNWPRVERAKYLADFSIMNTNFRRVPGYKVYCCGQPTLEGLDKALEKVLEGSHWPKDGRIVWLNMRQEPIIYLNGNPVCGRPPNKIGEYAELGDVTSK